MKRLLALALLLITLTAGAEPFKLEFDNTENNDLYVKYKKSDWQLVAHQNNWSIYLARGEVEAVKGYVVMYTMIVYDTPAPSQVAGVVVERIFNFGLVDCEGQRVFLLNDFFTDPDLKVVWVNKYKFGEFVSEMESATPRNKVHSLLCTGKHI